jgi:uroporphyrinogen-III synthase
MPSEPVVILTRPRGENERLAARLAAAGISSREIPCVELRPLDDPRPLRDAIVALTGDDLLVITSRAGARAVAIALDGAACAAPVAAVGAATAAACREAHLRVTFTPSVASGRALATEVPLPRGSILLARSDRGTPEPLALLAERRATVGEIVAYRTVSIAPAEAIPEHAIAVLASPSAVDGFALSGAPLAAAIAIGDTTAARVRTVLSIEPRVAGPDEADIELAVRDQVGGQHAIASR